jgi:nucleoside-diphosphate-sugar epimerase
MARICVTGASGKAGRRTAADLRDHGYDVVATDMVARAGDVVGENLVLADLRDYGETVDVTHGCDAVVHLANIPAPDMRPPAATFAENTTMNANVFLAAVRAGAERVVWASSETTLGLPFDVPPRYAPLDEEHYPFPTTTYALSKVVSETAATHVSEWSGVPFAALRFSNIMAPGDYAALAADRRDPRARRWNLWGYVDVDDVASACRRALEAPLAGAQSFIIAAADTMMDRPSADLLADVFPGVPVTRRLGEHDTLLSIDRAREVLGWEPKRSWRDAGGAGE